MCRRGSWGILRTDPSDNLFSGNDRVDVFRTGGLVVGTQKALNLLESDLCNAPKWKNEPYPYEKLSFQINKMVVYCRHIDVGSIVSTS